MTPDIVIYHDPCPDGFTAAWAIWKRFGDGVAFIGAKHGDAPPDVRNKHVVIVDFAYPRPVLEQMAESAASLIVLDHHKSAQADLEDFGTMPPPLSWDEWVNLCAINSDDTNSAARFDMTQSGAGLAWHFFHSTPVPSLVAHVEDRDLWRFALPDSRLIHAVITSHPYSFEIWDEMAQRSSTPEGLSHLRTEGAAIERSNNKMIEEMLLLVRRTMKIGGVDVPVANMPYHFASDAAGLLAQTAPFAATYYDRADGRVFSLRSKNDGGADVSVIAVSYGGGGHRHAAGFKMPHGWSGDETTE